MLQEPNNFQSTFKPRSILVFILVFVLVFSGWPFKIQEAQAAVSFVGSAEGGAANNADPTADLTTISGLAENDLVIAACGLGDADAVNLDVTMVSTGYTEVNDLFVDDTHETNFAVFYKFMGPTPDTSAVCEGSPGGNDTGTAIVVMAFRGVDTGTPFDVTSTTATNIDDPDADPPSIDWSTSGVWTVIAVASAHVLGTSCTSDAYVFPTGYTTDQIECAGNDTTDISVGMGYKSAPADPENPGIVDHNGTDSTSNSWAAVTMALRPAAEADLSWNTGAADFEIWAGATSTSDAVLTWDNGTLICSTSLTDDNSRQSTCGALNKNQKYRVQNVLKNVGGSAVNMNGASEFVDQVNVKTFWAGTSPTLDTCGFNDFGTDNGSTTCTLAFNATNNVRITNTGAGNVVIAATTGTEGFMYLITTDSDIPLSDSSTYMNASIDSITEDSSRVTIGLKRKTGHTIRGGVKIRGKIKFR